MAYLSEKAISVYEFLRKSLEDDGYSPSVREICIAIGFKSTSTAHKYLSELEEKGYIVKSKNLNRTIRLAEHIPKVSHVPILGKVAAGVPILAVEYIEGYVGVNSSYTSDELFALKISGDSMIEAGILDGDIIVTKKTPVASNGEIVVALIDDEATVKKYYKEKGVYRLQPCNIDYEPIITDHVKILGKVIKVIRDYE